MKHNKHIILFAVFVMMMAFVAGMPNYLKASVATMADKTTGENIISTEWNTLKDAIVDGTKDINTKYVNTAGMKSATGAITTLSSTDSSVTGSLAIPTGANPTVNAAGEIAHDTTDDTLILGDSGGTARVMSDGLFQANFILSATDFAAPSWDNVEIPVFVCPHAQAITIDRIVAGAVGGGTITLAFEARDYTTLGTSGTTVLAATPYDTVGIHATHLDDNTIAADTILFATTSGGAVSSTVKYLIGSIIYRKDVE